MDTLLATWGLSLVMQQAFRSTFGPREVSATLPDWLMGSLKPTPTIDIPINGLLLMALTLVLTGFVVWGLVGAALALAVGGFIVVLVSSTSRRR